MHSLFKAFRSRFVWLDRTGRISREREGEREREFDVGYRDWGRVVVVVGWENIKERRSFDTSSPPGSQSLHSV